MPRKRYKPYLPPANRIISAILRMGKKKKPKSKQGFTSMRTAAIEGELKKAGIDRASIDRMRGRKKSK